MTDPASTNWTIRFKGYLPVDHQLEDRLRRVISEIDSLPDSALEIDEAAHVITVDYGKVRGWLEASQETLGIVRFSRIVIKPPWLDYSPADSDIVVEIDPGTSFGSGLHESTALCIEALEDQLKPGQSVLDFGAGSGILAICAAKLGARPVTAIEADADSVEIALANVRRNGLEGVVKVLHEAVPTAAASLFDVVVANIVPPTLRAQSSSLFEVLKPGELLIASGMNSNQAGDMEEALSSAGFGDIRRIEKGQWVALLATAKRGATQNARTEEA